jgi:3,4-dihydroxy 2-butanone 4-phosphate synthase/GTP cyclohydrolase II
VRSSDDGPDRRAIYVPVDVRAGTHTGFSAADRAATIRALIDPVSAPDDFRIPGHVTPIGCRTGGVLERAGHTEATVDLMRLAGRTAAAVVCPLLAPTGDAATPEDACRFAADHGFPLVWIEDIVRYRRWLEDVIERVGETLLPLPEGRFRAIGYRDPYVRGEHMALVLGDLDGSPSVAVRVHTECLGGDALGFAGCGCRAHLHESMREISDLGTGVLLYLRAAGGDAARLRHVFALAGPDKVPDIGRPNDGVAISILRDLGVEADRAAVA